MPIASVDAKRNLVSALDIRDCRVYRVTHLSRCENWLLRLIGLKLRVIFTNRSQVLAITLSCRV